ncbi:MAG TPA: PEP-CTERM/exosortase system-associated acyltransferase [Candidatus Competibacter sp.]|nr:PEP-CTERM/exosortase system-associated acyltransferase [Candidatus Competibacter sp.]
MDTQKNLLDLFSQYFELILADTPERLEKCYRLRYEVYCKEALIPGFNAENYPDELEYDQYDKQSLHCLLMHKPTGHTAGTVRIILHTSEGQFKFPLEKATGLEIFPHALIGEVSRLIIAPEFRGRRGETGQPHGIAQELQELEDFTKKDGRRNPLTKWDGLDLRRSTPRRRFPHTVLGLVMGLVQMSFEHNLRYWYAGMELACARFLRSFGIDFAPISPIIDYYGPCKGYFCYIPAILEHVYRTDRQIWELLTKNGIFSQSS